MLPFLWVVLTLLKAMTDPQTIVSLPVDALWDGHTIAPAQLMAGPQDVSARLLRYKSPSHLDFFAGTLHLWPCSSGQFPK